jgi:hypothetical protein
VSDTPIQDNIDANGTYVGDEVMRFTPRQIQIHDESWSHEVRALRDRFMKMVEDRYPTIWAAAKKDCESRLMAHAPCSGCVIRRAKAYGLETEL